MNYFSKLLSFTQEKINNFFIEKKEVHQEESELSKNFDLFIQNDVSHALSVLQQGYTPSQKQNNELNQAIIYFAKTEKNFLHHIRQFEQLVSDEAFITYLLHYDLNVKCQNEYTVYQNFYNLLEKIFSRPNFSNKLCQQYISNISQLGNKISNFKPKHDSIHAFEFNSEENLIKNTYLINLSNVTILSNLLINNMENYLLLKTAINSTTKDIYKLIQQNNVKVHISKKKSYHYHDSNCKAFNTEYMNFWTNKFNEIDISKIKEKSLSLFKINSDKIDLSDKDDKITLNINNKKNQLPLEYQNITSNIQELYNKLTNENISSEQTCEIKSLYKNTSDIIDKYLAVSTEHRNEFTNIDGKTSDQLLSESLSLIQNKFQTQLELTCKSKIQDLSITNRVIQMKT